MNEAISSVILSMAITAWLSVTVLTSLTSFGFGLRSHERMNTIIRKNAEKFNLYAMFLNFIQNKTKIKFINNVSPDSYFLFHCQMILCLMTLNGKTTKVITYALISRRYM